MSKRNESDLNLIINVIKKFQEEYHNKEFLIVLNEQYFIARFSLSNLPHLLGFSYIGFEKDYFNNNIQNKKIIKNKNFKNKFNNNLSLFSFKKSSVLYGKHDKQNVYLEADIMIGAISFTIAFKQKSNYYVPISFLIGDTREYSSTTHSIKLIIEKYISETKFNKVTKKAKGLSNEEYSSIINKLNLNNKIDSKIVMK